MKSALFVDFDNVYSGLRKLDPGMADRFAFKPQRWMQWLVSSLGLPEHSPRDSRRRVLVRRCYLNPQAYQRFRPSFNLAGFEIVDCPALTSEGKTSTDIHMVLDIIDLLQHEAHYDEFIVFSADADFTPVLRRLRRWDRRTTVLAIGFPSAAYRASADMLIDQDDFIRAALGFRDDDELSAPESPTPLVRRNEQELARAALSHIRKAIADSPVAVPVSRLAATVLAKVEGMDASTWAGFGSFRQLLESFASEQFVLDWVSGGVIFDPKRHPSPAASTQPAIDLEGELAGISSLIVNEVVKSKPQPVSCARLAQLVTTRFPTVSTDWHGLGTFRKLVESLNLGSLVVDWKEAGGRIYDPAEYPGAISGADEKPARQNGNLAVDWGKDADLWSIASQIHDVTGTPLMAPADYGILFRQIASDLTEHAFELNETSKRVRDRMRASGHPLGRSDITWVLRGLLFRGHVFGDGKDEASSLARKSADNIRSLCLREQMVIDVTTDMAIGRWIAGEAK